MKVDLSQDEQLAMGALIPVIALMATLVEQKVIPASVLRDRLQSMLDLLPDELAPASLTNRVRTGALTALTILSQYKDDDGEDGPNSPTPQKPQPDWLRAIIEGGRGKSDT